MQLQARLQLRGLPSGLSDLGSERRVLLPDGSVVLQDPLQVGHSFVSVFCLDLWKTTAPEVSGSRWAVLKVQTLVNHPSTLQMKPAFTWTRETSVPALEVKTNVPFHHFLLIKD